MVTAYIALGANLGDPAAAVREAHRRLERPGLRVLRRARTYRTRPVGPADQPDFVNTVVEVETSRPPAELLATLKAIEVEMGRTPTVRWGPRVIDLDIALYGDETLETPDLVIPHRELPNRRFVLAPLADLCPDREVPGRGASVRALLHALGEDPGDLAVLDDRIVEGGAG